MSPTILRQGGFQFIIFVNDHPPAHVHVRRAGNVARVRLQPVEILHNIGYNQRELRTIRTIVERHQRDLLNAWNAIHGDEQDAG